MVLFETLKERWIIRGKIKILTPIHIGRGRGEKDLGEADLPILKLPDGTPYIPGSSLKGVVRSQFDRIMTGLGIRVCIYQRSKSPISPDYDCEPDKLCVSCAMFGSTAVSSRVIFRDSYPLERTETLIRPGVALARDTKTVAKGPFEIEFVPPGTEFSLEIVIENPEEWMIGALIIALENIIGLGGSISRGLGKVKIQISSIEIWTPESMIRGEPFKKFTNQNLIIQIEKMKKIFSDSIEKLKNKYGELKKVE